MFEKPKITLEELKNEMNGLTKYKNVSMEYKKLKKELKELIGEIDELKQMRNELNFLDVVEKRKKLEREYGDLIESLEK